MPNSPDAPYPLIFQPALFAKVWGGDRLSRLGRRIQPGEKIGESWEVAEMPTTSASGAGGAGVSSVVANGALKGKRLGEVVALWGSDLLGEQHASAMRATGFFPLLVKYLDAREDLSVQVHPSPAFAASNPHAHLKTECWYIVEATENAKIYKGCRAGVTKEQFREAIARNCVVDLLDAVRAVPGECHLLPSGTVHALGAGVLAAEVQTPSDTTFRVYDWGRTDRQLHIDEALACIDFGPAPAPIDMRFNPPRGGVVRTPFFDVWRVACANEEDIPIGHGKGCFAVMALRGHGSLFSEDGEYAPVDLFPGRTVLVPACVAASTNVRPGEEVSLECLVAALPV